jgi:hypothetical protein
MRIRPVHLALLWMLPLAGCTAINSPATPTETLGTYTNWQIQSGTTITPSAQGPVFMTGAMLIQGSQVTGTFSTDAICPAQPNPVENFTGSYDASTGVLTLTATPIGNINVQLTIPSTPSTVAVGTMGAAGEICALAMQGPAVGVEIAPLAGAYTGTVAAANSNPPSAPATGVATLTLTQAAAANASAQFPISGTLQFTASSSACSSSTAVTGTISGAGFSLASTTLGITISGSDSASSDNLSVTNITFANGPCNTGTAATYAGSLVK